MELKSGVVLAEQYELIEQLGRGGQGVVYKAKDIATDRIVAIKIVPDEIIDDAKSLRRLQKEFNLADKLTHQYIVKPLHFESRSSPRFFVMDYVPGATLADVQERCENHVFPLTRAVRILKKVAEALDFAHKHGVVHRDIKPHNILLGTADEVKVTDFGIGDEIRTSMTRTMSKPFTSGTVPYMSPEQLKTGKCDERTDIYALAILLYEMLTGAPPYPAVGLCSQPAGTKPEPIPELKKNQMAVIYKSLEYDKGKRFKTCGEFVNAFEEATNPLKKKVPAYIWLPVLILLGVGIWWLFLRPGGEKLDICVSKLAKEIVKDLPDNKKVRVAVIGYADKTGERIEGSLMVEERLRTSNVLKDKCRLMNRTEIESILEELSFQLTDLADVNKALEFGKIAGAEKLLRGKILEEGKDVSIYAYLVDVETGDESHSGKVTVSGMSLPGNFFTPLNPPLERGEIKDGEMVPTSEVGSISTDEGYITPVPTETPTNTPKPRKPIPRVTYWAGELIKVELPGTELTIDMVFIPSGEFVMGSSERENRVGRGMDEEPQHNVTIVEPFWIGKCEVTQKLWRSIMKTDPPGLNFGGCDECPVDSVSWLDVQEFIRRLNNMVPGGGFRLPSESEWEYACRAGSPAMFNFGYDEYGMKDYGWCSGVSDGDKTHPVGSKIPNEWGLYDMHGNVREWCMDTYYPDYFNAPEDGSARETEEQSDHWRVLRGGSWCDPPWDCRSAKRFYEPQEMTSYYNGFRLVRSISEMEDYKRSMFLSHEGKVLGIQPDQVTENEIRTN